MESETTRVNKTTDKVWHKYESPIRQLVLWGWDKAQNPAFCILYGIQQTERRENGDYFLKDAVDYELYYIVQGQKGHLPSFPEVKVKELSERLSLFYPEGGHYDWYNKEYHGLIKESKYLEKKITLPYYKECSYPSIVKEIKAHYGDFDDFYFAENPNEILLLKEHYQECYQAVCELFCNPNRYMRKKYLQELLDRKLPQDFYQHILKIGSTELIAGIFLELAKRHDPILLKEAQNWKEEEAFAEKNYMIGVERCAAIYCNAIDDKKKEEREREIREHLSEMDLHIISLDNKKELQQEMDGTAYRLYAQEGILQPYKYKYIRENNKWKKKKLVKPPFYKESIYCDGRMLNIIAVKNTIQEAEVYGLYDVIGKIAYYIDAPRIYYSLQSNNRGGGTRNYFRRYLRRIIDQCARENPDIYMNIMKVLFTGYQKGDYLCKYEGNFQYNYFISQYLYTYAKGKINSPQYNRFSGERQYQKELAEYKKNDQFLKQKERLEAYPEIWNQHLKETAEIAVHSEVESIVKACYYILKENMEEGRLQAQLDEELIVSLCNSFYEPLKKLGEELLAKHLENVENIKEEMLLALLKSNEPKLQKVSISYIETHNVSMDLLVSIILIKENKTWYSVWKKKILELSEEELLMFLLVLFAQKENFKEWDIEEVADVLHIKGLETQKYGRENKKKLLDFFFSALYSQEQLPKLFINIIQDILFSFQKEELRELLKEDSFEKKQMDLSPQKARIINLLFMIKDNKVSNSAQVADLIEEGSSQMLHQLAELLEENKEIFSEKMEIFLMLAESPVLLLNETAKRALQNAEPEKKKEQLILLISSPIERAYLLGLSEIEKEYSDNIPEEFLLKMLEHPSEKVKIYIAEKSVHIIEALGNGNSELFLYYVKTLLYLPNKTAKSKQLIYQKLPSFVKKYPEEILKAEQILLDIGGSNCKKDAEQALVALAKIRSEVETLEG